MSQIAAGSLLLFIESLQGGWEPPFNCLISVHPFIEKEAKRITAYLIVDQGLGKKLISQGPPPQGGRGLAWGGARLGEEQAHFFSPLPSCQTH